MYGMQERSFAFGQTDNAKLPSSISVGENAYSRSGSIMIGSHDYGGKLGDTTVDPTTVRSKNINIEATTLGSNSYNQGAFSTVNGAYSIISGKYNGSGLSNYGGQNFGATITGSLNSIESATDGYSTYSGIANSIVGTANRTANSNGSLVFGAGNEATNSITDISAPTNGGNSAKDLQDALKNAVRDSESGGATLAIGGGNKADYTQKTSIIGVNNTVTGTESGISKYNSVTGFKNTVSNANHVSVIGSQNNIESGNSDVVIGDYHKLTGTSNNNVILGSMKPIEHTTTSKVFNWTTWQYEDVTTTTYEEVAHTKGISNAVMLGYNTDVTKDGGVALGSEAVASTDKGVAGYDPVTKTVSTDGSATWKSTAAAVSVGDASKQITRQITGVAAGREDTDAVNVAQLKKAGVKVQKKEGSLITVDTTTGDSGTVYTVGVDTSNMATKTDVSGVKTHYYSVKSDKTGEGSNYANDGAKATDSLVAGINSTTEGINSTVLGNNNTLTGVKNGKNNSIVAGQGLTVDGTHNAVFGTDYDNYDHKETKVYGEANTVLGVGNLVGYTAVKDSTDPTKWIYTKNSSGSDQNVVVGMQNTSNGGSVVVGTSSVAESLGTSIGHGNTIIGMNDGGGQRGVAVGNNLTVKGEETVAIGTDSKANADWTIAMGSTAKAEKTMDMAVGYGAKASGGWSMAMGVSSSAEGSTSTALGYGAKSTIDDGVALGSYSVANTASDVAGYDPSTKAASTETGSTWKSVLGAVSVGDKTKGYTRQITGVAAGAADTDAVNVAQLKKAAEAATNGAVTKGFALSEDAKTPVSQPLGEAIQLKGENGIVTTADAANHKVTISMGDNVKVGKDGKDGKPGVNGTIGVNGGDGKSSVGINGKDGISVKGDKGEVGINGNDGISIKGEAGKDGISVNGKDGKPGVTITAKDGSDGHIGINGKDGSLADISVKNGAPGVNGTDGITRIVYEDKTGNPHEIATLDDGMKYAGDIGNDVAIKLNHKATVSGGVNDETKLSTEDNIGVIGKKSGDDAALTLRLAKNLKGLDSVTAGTVVVGKDKDGKNYVTGLDNTTWNGTAVSGRAATEDQLKAVADSVATTVGNGKLTFKGDTGSVDKKLGETLPITGDKNITTAASADGVKISLKKDVDLGNDGSIKAGNTTINKDGITTNIVTATTVKAGDTTVTTDGMTINGGPTITKTNVDMGGQQIHHVKDGSAADDAATVGQVDKKVSESVKSASVTGGTIGSDGSISLTKGDNSPVTLAGKMKDISAKAGTYDITGGKVTIGMQDNYSKADAGNIVINDVAKASDLTKEVSDRKAADKAITNTIGAESPEKLKEAFKETTYLKGSGSLADAEKALDKAVRQNAEHDATQDAAINTIGNSVNKLGNRVNRVGAGSPPSARLRSG